MPRLIVQEPHEANVRAAGAVEKELLLQQGLLVQEPQGRRGEKRRFGLCFTHVGSFGSLWSPESEVLMVLAR